MNNKCTLFLGDLSAFVTEQDIHNVFAPYGEIVEIKIMRSEETMRNLSYGFIKFSHSNSAKRAMNNLDGVLFCGRHLR
jgi:RNA recognition motif-containing protein